jgi:hypothetical protein
MRIVPLYHTHCIIHRTQHRRRGDGRNSFVWICMVFLHCWFGWKGGGEGSNVLHHRHTFVSGIGDGDGLDSLGPWWRGRECECISMDGWMDGGLRHMQIIPHSFVPKFIRLECISHVLAQRENKKHLVKPPGTEIQTEKRSINPSKQASAFHPTHIHSFISSHSSQRMKRR